MEEDGREECGKNRGSNHLGWRADKEQSFYLWFVAFHLWSVTVKDALAVVWNRLV